MGELITARNVVKTFSVGEVEVTALDGVDFSIEQGELVVILGPSGSGKSTMLNLIGGIDSATTVEIWYEDRPLHELDRQGLTAYRRAHIGFVFQFYNLMPNLSALDNVMLVREMSEPPLDGATMLDRV